MLLYFFADFGELKRIGTIDIYVFPTICFIGIIMNYKHNYNILKFQIKHLELCLSNLDAEILPIVAKKIDDQQKKERTTNLLIGIIVLLSLLLLVAVLKEMGI